MAVWTGGILLAGSSAGRRTLIEKSSRKRPEWIVRLPQDDRYFYSRGFATGVEDLAEAEAAAAVDAVEEVIFYVGLQATARYEERRTSLATDVLSLIETSGSARISGGRTADLYFERYRETSGRFSRYVYDVYVLVRIPLAEIEAERARLVTERSEAKQEAARLVAETSPASLAEDFIGGLSGLMGAWRRLAQIAPGASSLNRLETLVAEMAARVSVLIESVEPGPDGDARVVTASATLAGPEGSVPLRNLPLELIVSQGAERESVALTTGADGTARAELLFPVDPFRRALVEVRLHPSASLAGRLGAEGQREPAGAVEPIVAPFEQLGDYRVVHLRPGEPAPGQTPAPVVARDVAPGSVPANAPVRVSLGRETRRGGRASAVTLPVLVRLNAPPPHPDSRPPLNLALVLDRSESMGQTSKLEALLSAASLVVSHLSADDVLTVVAYGDEASVLVPAQSVTARRTLLYELSRLDPRGRTNLSGGIRLALEQLRPHIRPGTMTRMLVLTDGRATAGSVEPASLVDLASEVRQSGAQLSLVGLGGDVDRALLSRMARGGGGRYYDAPTASSLPGIFALDLRGLLTQALDEVRIELQLADGVSLARAYGFPVRVTRRGVEVLAGGLPAGESFSILLDLKVDCQEPVARRAGTMDVYFRDAMITGLTKVTRSELSASCAPGRMLVGGASDPYVDLYARLSRAADTLQVVLSSWDVGLVAEMEAYLAEQQPEIRREVEVLADPELLDLVRFIDRGAVDMWAGISHLIESAPRRDPRLFPQYRLYELRHYDTQIKRKR